MSLYNFWIMDASVCALTLVSAFYGEKTRRRDTSKAGTNTKTITAKELPSRTSPNTELKEQEFTKPSILWYLLLNFSYFAIMALTVLFLQFYPNVMVALQHFAVISFLILAFTQWIPGKFGYFTGMLVALIWISSVGTSYRWLINNVIIAMFALLASHVQFRNFAFLQIFLWTAFVYDVCLLAKMNTVPQLFSVGECGSLLCKLFEINDVWQLPAVFTVCFGDSTTHVFLGTGDIVIGAIISNFSFSFFKCSKCLLWTVSSFGLAIGLLSRIDSNRPYPALVSIVPCCSIALVLCAVCCRKTRRLFSMTHREFDYKEEDLIVI